MDGESEKPVLVPLRLTGFSQQCRGENSDIDTDQSCSLTPCVLCHEMFNTADAVQRKACLEHLLTVHRLVIGEIEMVADLKSYFRYWKERLKEQPIADFCTTFNSDKSFKSPSKSCDPSNDKFYLLCDVLPEDKELRQFLQKQKLTKVLEYQQQERNGSDFSRGCLFCREHFTGRRATLINHMAEDHSFNIGQPDNLVYIDEFLEILQTKLNNLLCLYCEKTFKDRLTLKEHMRKKQHKRINPNNKIYDKFYIINYLELGKNWELIQSEDDDDDYETDDDGDDNEREWSEWEEDSGAQALCLFCEFSSSSPGKLQNHMSELHDFDLQELRREKSLGFYDQVKLINYIRRQIHQCSCYGCSNQFPSKRDLLDHMHKENHITLLPNPLEWNQPQYYFPTYENDYFLCQLEDGEEDVDNEIDTPDPIWLEPGVS